MTPLARLRKIIQKSTLTQRCWDLSQTIPEQDLDTIIYSATAAPVKQNYAYFRLHVVLDRTLVERLYDTTEGFGLGSPQGMRIVKNSQILANTVLVFEPYNTGENLDRNLERRKQDTNSLKYDQDSAISMAAAYANFTAHTLGYRTGFCACFDHYQAQSALGTEEMPKLMLGIGYPDTTKHRCRHHSDSTITYPSHPKETVPVVHYPKHT